MNYLEEGEKWIDRKGGGGLSDVNIFSTLWSRSGYGKDGIPLPSTSIGLLFRADLYYPRPEIS